MNLYPPSGYIFKDADGVLHKGDSWRDLFRNVKAYRERNGKPLGDIEAEVNTQHCAETPGLCHGPPGPPPAPLGHSLNQRVVNSMGQILISRRQRSIPAHVSPGIAAQRAAICAVCPKQQALSSACESCLNTIYAARKVILGEQVAANQSLHPCGALGEDCVTMVHLDVPRSNEPEQPANCWRRG